MPDTLLSAIKFNEFKHMKVFQQETPRRWKLSSGTCMLDDLSELGGNQFDVYTGRLTTEAVVSQVAVILDGLKISSREDLRAWLGGQSYRQVHLRDGSRWVIREGEEPGKFVHLHPGRNQAFVKRLKASHLKTALVILYENRESQVLDPARHTDYINRIRKERLGLSPVKSAADSRRIREALEFLTGDET